MGTEEGAAAPPRVGRAGQPQHRSRNRYLKAKADETGPADDNFGFAAWVAAHEEELRGLGPGRHYGEWWGSGIQRRYGLNEKRFSLFNVGRWWGTGARPACCHMVPVLWRGVFDTAAIAGALGDLAINGSVAAPGFMYPEGVVIFHAASGVLFKKTIEKDEAPKGAS